MTKRELIEALEPRVLLAAAAIAGYAPSSLIGRAATLAITSGTGDYPAFGSALFAVSSNSNEYYYLGLSANLDSSHGTYSYTRTSANTASLTTWDQTFGLSAVNLLSFTSTSGGTFTVSGSAGKQSGTFSIVATPNGPAPTSVTGKSFAFQISGGHGRLASAGNFTITTAASFPDYTLVGSGVMNSSGHYSYLKTSTGTAHLAMSDSVAGYLKGELSFTNSSSGTFLFGNVDTDSWQIGYFSIINAAPVGSVDLCTNRHVCGWAQDPTTPNAAVTVLLHVDGVQRDAVTANISRSDLLEPLGSAAHAYDFDLRDMPAGAHRIDVYAADTSNGPSTLLGSRVVNFGTLPVATIDAAGMKVSGWAVDPDSLSGNVRMALAVDNMLFDSTMADRSRPDLVRYFGSADHGYSFDLSSLEIGLHKVGLYVYDEGTNTNTLITTRTVNTNALPFGSVDQLDGTTLAGWVYDPNEGEDNCTIIYQIDGGCLSGASASEKRPDLTPVLGSPNHGFKVALPVLPNTPHTLTVWGLDENTSEVVGMTSRTFFGSSNVRGSLDVATGNSVAGWAYDPVLGGKPSQVRIVVDLTTVATVTAQLSRPDLQGTYGTTRLGFNYKLSLKPGSHIVEIQAYDNSTKAWVQLGSKVVRTAQTSGPATIVGSLDKVNESTISGWAYSPSNPGGTSLIRITIDSYALEWEIARAARKDLTSYLGTQYHGFNLTMPTLAPGTYTIRLYDIDQYMLFPTLIATTTYTVTELPK